jgi:hypothetical protein
MDQQCKLCLQVAVLRRSHVVPEFVYRPVFGTDHTAVVLEPNKSRRSHRQTGYWERLLCDGCERRLGQLETYFADVWFKRPLRPARLGGLEVRVEGLDYSRFKLFFLSVLWRAGVSTLAAFQDVSLGAHAERIRRRILAADPGAQDIYPITGLALRDDDGGFKDNLMLLPGGGRIDGHHVYLMLFGGVFWSCAVSGHSAGRPAAPSLREDGSLTLLVQDWRENSAIREMAQKMSPHSQRNAV